ncbi:hypothetical protein Poli38472_010507 [Pythium oligandrum]|uniref:Uncharacterized protein n=1 Tax=Pythium oligandrum TaxID=41045 RepID=A0A8K1C398_PYTOL|nr:hypothetical protein Poli38472_010507 [Pythium oligandrum]|eukprot:TMW55625.1 hypothetical protein Poli38472_010507 [Pythium oligandrum]
MGRHRRTGNIGQTNLNQLRKELEQPEKERQFRQLGGPLLEDRERVVLHAKQKNRQRRAQWRLDLSLVERSHVGDASPHRRDLGSDAEAVLASKIEEIQRDRKTFKDEPWYRSPIGPGSKASVVLAALVQQDAQDTGYLAYSQIRQTLQSTNLGLNEKQTQQLLNKYDPNLVETSPIHYRTFVRHLHFADPDEKPDDVIFRQQTYLEKIRTHANHLLETGTTLSTSLGPFHAAPSLIQLSPLAKRAMLSVTNNEPDVVLGNPPEYSPSRLSPLGKHPPANDVDPLSFEHDKRRKELRAATKARILLNHIDRVQEYARHQDAAIVHHDHARLAAKAMHHHDHLAHVYDQEQRFLHRLENRGKALLQSEATKVNRNVSKDSMFY